MAQWFGPLPPPRPPSPPTAWEKVKDVFWRAMELEGEAEIAEGEMYQAEGEAISEWLGDKGHEHIIAGVFDVIGVIGFLTLFVPGVGEAEMGMFAAVRAGQYLLAAGKVTAGMAAAGSAMGLWVDGNYVYRRYLKAGDQVGRDRAAEEWEQDPQNVTLSLTAAILCLPDFAVGGIPTLRSLRELPAAIRGSRQMAEAVRVQEAAKLAKMQQLEGRAAGDLPEWHAKKLQQKAAEMSSRAERLAQRAREAERKSQSMMRKLVAIWSTNVPGFAGVSQTSAYYFRDNASDETEPFKTSYKYLRSLIEPNYCKAGTAGDAGHNIGLQIGATCRTSTSQR